MMGSSSSVVELLAAIDDLGPTLAKRSAEAERAGALSPDTATELRLLGVHRLLQPTAFGGAQDSIEAHMRIVAAVGRHCMAASWCVAVWSAHNWMTGSFPTAGQEAVWAEPDTLVSASIVPKTRFELAGDQVLVQGRFPFASGCDHAPWLGVGGLLAGEAPTYVICLLPADDVIIDHDSWDVVGLRGTGSKDLVIDEPVAVPPDRVLRVPEAMVRSAPGQQGPDRVLYRAPFRATAAIVLAAPALGAAQAALDRFTERLDGHLLMATGSAQRGDPAAGLRLAESSAEVNSAELVLLEAARRLDDLAAVDEPDPVAVAAVFRDTAYGVRLCARAVDRLYEASGGTALQADEPMQRYWRDVHAARAHAILTWDGAAGVYANAVLGQPGR